ncbi:hypothetical protein Sme01_71900 [Sphaerisporangium melleum]|uniref:Uncharacterized protein n=1 Tax=Sphaerisporangium melleum TaxID=321316 RepID=A0A917RP95_9ACTN|nr:hypothetical protein GCM10007964_69500 [Sphaerisporangium melleum]GII74714.1 hypothetical protein Sme01_71900 [Sphaerisporangium melleum]
MERRQRAPDARRARGLVPADLVPLRHDVLVQSTPHRIAQHDEDVQIITAHSRESRPPPLAPTAPVPPAVLVIVNIDLC